MRLSVRDHGIGLRREGQEHLFDEFFSTRSRASGWDCAIVRSIVESHGGKNRSGKCCRWGSAVLTLICPSARRQRDERSKNMVFVIDDDAAVRKGLKRLLMSPVINAKLFASATDFLARQPQPGPTCLVVDVQMPGLNGIAFQEDAPATSTRRAAHFPYRAW